MVRLQLRRHARRHPEHRADLPSRRVLEPFKTLEGFLHNSAVQIGRWVIAGSRLWTAPGLIITPHAAHYSVESEREKLQVALEDVVRVIEGRPPHFPSDPSGSRR